jgi:hypothetical protein
MKRRINQSLLLIVILLGGPLPTPSPHPNPAPGSDLQDESSREGEQRSAAERT